MPRTLRRSALGIDNFLDRKSNQFRVIVFDFQDFGASANELDDVPFFWQLSRSRHQHAGNGINVLVVQVQPHRFFNIGDVRATLNNEFTFAGSSNLRLVEGIKFVIYRADNFLQHVFQRHDPNNGSVFVDDESQQLVRGLEMSERIANGHVFGDFGGFPHQSLDVEVRVWGDAQEIFRVNHTQQ